MNYLEQIVESSFLNNGWVTGIGGGILSGFIVYFVTKRFFSQKDNSEYLRRVESVNREIVTTLKADISEGDIPDLVVFEALINATCRKYNVISTDVYRPHQIAEDLIKEVMDSSFISSDSKQKYCESLLSAVQIIRTIKDDEHDKEAYTDANKNSAISIGDNEKTEILPTDTPTIEKKKIKSKIENRSIEALLALFSTSVGIIVTLIANAKALEIITVYIKKNMYILELAVMIMPLIVGLIFLLAKKLTSTKKNN